jgi:hypothetical protein
MGLSYAESILSEEWKEKHLKIIRKRRVQDSGGIWYSLTQSAYIWFIFNDLVGFTKNHLYPNLDRSFDVDLSIMDASFIESKKSGLPLDLCFQNEVLKRSNDAMIAEAYINLAKKDSEDQE